MADYDELLQLCNEQEKKIKELEAKVDELEIESLLKLNFGNQEILRIRGAVKGYLTHARGQKWIDDEEQAKLEKIIEKIDKYQIREFGKIIGVEYV